MVKLAIFDLDGTLVDSIYDIMVSANHVIQSYGREPFPLDNIKNFIGDGLKSFVKGLAGDRHGDEEFMKKVVSEFMLHYDTQLLKNTRFYSGVEEFLQTFIKHPERRVGVVTNKPEGQARVILRHLGYPDEFFVEIFGGDTFDVKKPHPKPLQEMMKIAGVEPGQTVMVGDSRQDVEAAINAGTHFVAVSFGYNSRETLRGHGAKTFIDHFSELHRKIDSLFI